MRFAERSRKGLLLGVLLLIAGGCYKGSSYSPTDPQVTGALTLAPADGTLSIPADGVSRVTLVATIAADADSDKRVITFTTSSGSFVGAPAGSGTTVDVTAGSDGRALVILQSSQTVGTAIVTAAVKGAASVAVQRQIQFTAPNADDVLRFVAAPAAAPADGQTITLFTVAVAPSVSTGTVTFSSTAGTFPSATVPIGIDHTATAGLMSSKTPGVATVSATLSGGGTNGFSRQVPFRFDVALPNVISVVVDSLTVMPGGKVHVTAHLTRLIGQVTANTVAAFSALDPNGNEVGGFENVTVVQPGASATDSIATADYLPGATARPGPVTITVGTDPPSVTGSTTITVVGPSV
jgi:hypothetical protein